MKYIREDPQAYNMGEWPLHCFKAYDIRGLSGEELSDEFAYRLGRAMATYLECSSFAVGRDIRKSSPGYATETTSTYNGFETIFENMGRSLQILDTA